MLARTVGLGARRMADTVTGGGAGVLALELPRPMHVEEAEDEQADHRDESQRVTPPVGAGLAQGGVAAERLVFLVGLEARAVLLEHDVGVEAEVVE